MGQSFEDLIAAHAGRLIRITSRLWWLDGRGSDDREGRIALVIAPDGGEEMHAITDTQARDGRAGIAIAALLLEGQSQPLIVALEANSVEFL